MRTTALMIRSLLATTVLASPAFGQDATLPPREFVDQNGVNLASGTMIFGEPSVSIGSGVQGLIYSRRTLGNAQTYRYAIAGGDLNHVTVIDGVRISVTVY